MWGRLVKPNGVLRRCVINAVPTPRAYSISAPPLFAKKADDAAAAAPKKAKAAPPPPPISAEARAAAADLSAHTAAAMTKSGSGSGGGSGGGISAAAGTSGLAATAVSGSADAGVGERTVEPEVFVPFKYRGIDNRSIEYRIHSAVANRPIWGPRGAWGRMVREAEAASKAAMEARGQVYTPPANDWKEQARARVEKREREKKAAEEAEAAIVKRDQDKINALFKPLGLLEFADKFHSLEHVLSVKTITLKKYGLECAQRKLLLKHTEIARQRAARGLRLFPGSGPVDPALTQAVFQAKERVAASSLARRPPQLPASQHAQ